MSNASNKTRGSVPKLTKPLVLSGLKLILIPLDPKLSRLIPNVHFFSLYTFQKLLSPDFLQKKNI
ncbi:hypothetical protein BOO23_19920 [Vibrio navarrensis]|nr:hypothetical protein [Vibrio navarrensis]